MIKKPKAGRRKSVISGTVPQYRSNRVIPGRHIGEPPKNSVPKMPPIPTGARLPQQVVDRLKKNRKSYGSF